MLQKETKVEYLENVVEDLNSLIDILYEKEYFGYIDTAKRYVADMKNYIEYQLPNRTFVNSKNNSVSHVLSFCICCKINM
jgi:hypothetical protein